MSDTPVEEMSFEQAMAELEQVVGQLERRDPHPLGHRDVSGVVLLIRKL